MLARVPQCERQVVDWTREEIELGPHPVGVDAFAGAVRRQALERLAGELHAALLRDCSAGGGETSPLLLRSG